MAETRFVELKRGLVSVAGVDRRTFLQGLISQDVNRLSATMAAYGAFLTPQGKYLHDFCLAEIGDAIILDGEQGRADDLTTQLKRFKLRAKIEIAPVDDLRVFAIFGDRACAAFDLADAPGAARALTGGVVFVDPRTPQLGCRLIAPANEAAALLAQRNIKATPFADYDGLRIGLGVPDGTRDMDVDKSTLLECNFDALNGVDWEKGCYIGQEVTARTKYRGLVKRRLLPVVVEGASPTPGAALCVDGKVVGELRSVGDGVAIASIRLDALESAKSNVVFTAEDAIIVPKSPISKD